MDFSFFAHRFLKENLRKLQGQNCQKLIIGENMVSFRLAHSRVILLYTNGILEDFLQNIIISPFSSKPLLEHPSYPLKSM